MEAKKEARREQLLKREAELRKLQEAQQKGQSQALKDADERIAEVEKAAALKK